MINMPDVKTGIVAVSRDCFPVSLSIGRRRAVVEELKKLNIEICEIETVVENENDAVKALKEIEDKNCDALVIYLGNFGPEGPETYLAQKFNKPVMFTAAAEETGDNLISGRGDAFCGMLNASYSLGLRNIKAYIPKYPVADAANTAVMISEFITVSKIVTGVRNLKIFSFGPRPQDFYACNAPIKPLFDIGAEIMENSELDLYESYIKHENDPRIPDVVNDMQTELGKGNMHPGILAKLARYEITLNDWFEKHIGVKSYGVFANKCWPAFQTQFGFVPCYVNSRFASRGIPIACETDIYGALSEYILTIATQKPATLLDINNTVPDDMYKENVKVTGSYKNSDLFMGFHCGNTSSSCMNGCSMGYQLIMHRLLEPDNEPDITRGTLEGNIKASDITLFRLQSTADAKLRSYIAQGEILDMDCKSFGSIGVIAIREMDRFYRHVLIEKNYPHHAGVGFSHSGKAIFDALKLMGVKEIDFNRPQGMLYDSENPFK